MLVRSTVNPATLAKARAVGIRPGSLVRRCVSLALRRAASSFWRGAYTPDAEPAGAAGASSSFCSRAYTPPHAATP